MDMFIFSTWYFLHSIFMKAVNMPKFWANRWLQLKSRIKQICFIVLSTTPPLKVFQDFNWAKFPRMWKISSHNSDTALLIIYSNWTNKHLNIFNDSIGFPWMWCSYVQFFKSFALFVLKISRVEFIMVRIFRNSQ